MGIYTPTASTLDHQIHFPALANSYSYSYGVFKLNDDDSPFYYKLVRFVDTRAPGSHELVIKGESYVSCMHGGYSYIRTYTYKYMFNSYTLKVPGPSFSFCSTSIRSSQSHSSQVDLLLPLTLFSYYLTGSVTSTQLRIIPPGI